MCSKNTALDDVYEYQGEKIFILPNHLKYYFLDYLESAPSPAL